MALAFWGVLVQLDSVPDLVIYDAMESGAPEALPHALLCNAGNICAWVRPRVPALSFSSHAHVDIDMLLIVPNRFLVVPVFILAGTLAQHAALARLPFIHMHNDFAAKRSAESDAALVYSTGCRVRRAPAEHARAGARGHRVRARGARDGPGVRGGRGVRRARTGAGAAAAVGERAHVPRARVWSGRTCQVCCVPGVLSASKIGDECTDIWAVSAPHTYTHVSRGIEYEALHT
jgi:hypothetical protein